MEGTPAISWMNVPLLLILTGCSLPAGAEPIATDPHTRPDVVVSLTCDRSEVPSNSRWAASGASASQARRAERRWLDAYEQNDIAAMRSLLAPGFVIRHANGRSQDRDQILASMMRVPAEAPRYRHRTENVRATQYGATVILRGEVISVIPSDPAAAPERSLYTDVYIWRCGRWQVIASHLSAPPPMHPQ